MGISHYLDHLTKNSVTQKPTTPRIDIHFVVVRSLFHIHICNSSVIGHRVQYVNKT